MYVHVQAPNILGPKIITDPRGNSWVRVPVKIRCLISCYRFYVVPLIPLLGNWAEIIINVFICIRIHIHMYVRHSHVFILGFIYSRAYRGRGQDSLYTNSL